MSISQHIAGIRSRTSQNRSSLSEKVDDATRNADSNLEQSSLSHEDELTNKMSHVEIGEATNAKSLQSPSFASLEQIDFEQDFDDKLQRMEVLNTLEKRWTDLNANLEATLNHLEDCCNEVTQSSTFCLDSLKSSVETTCDKVDGELKAFYHLMTKCDELNTKLSIASSFREEIKTLRKSVDTLEQLYKR